MYLQNTEFLYYINVFNQNFLMDTMSTRSTNNIIVFTDDAVDLRQHIRAMQGKKKKDKLDGGPDFWV